MLGRGHRARVAPQRIYGRPAPARRGDCGGPRPAPHDKSRAFLSRCHCRQVTLEQRRVYYKDKRPGMGGAGCTLASGAAHSRAPSGTGSAAAQAAADANKALELGREKRGLADMKRAVAKMVDEPLFVATPKQVTLAQQVGGAGIFNESCLQAGRAASVTWTAAAYSAAQSLCRSARGQLDAVFGGRAGPRRPAGQRRRAARAGRVPPEPQRAVPRARQQHSNRLNDKNARLSKRQAAFQRNATLDGDLAKKSEFEKFARVPCPSLVFVLWPAFNYNRIL